MIKQIHNPQIKEILKEISMIKNLLLRHNLYLLAQSTKFVATVRKTNIPFLKKGDVVSANVVEPGGELPSGAPNNTGKDFIFEVGQTPDGLHEVLYAGVQLPLAVPLTKRNFLKAIFGIL